MNVSCLFDVGCLVLIVFCRYIVVSCLLLFVCSMLFVCCRLIVVVDCWLFVVLVGSFWLLIGSRLIDVG